MGTESEYQFQCSRAGWAWGENRESGENPERYRHCKQRRPYPKSESGSLDGFREDRGRLRMRKPGYLLNLGFRRGLQVRAVRRLLAQKYGLRQFLWLPQSFRFSGAVKVVSPLPASNRLPSGKETCVN